MKHPDYDKAFAPTPEIVSLSIEAAFRKGEKAMKFRHKLTAALSAAAVIAVVCAAAVFALPNEPRPDVVGQPVLTNPTEKTYSSSVSYDAEGNIVHLESEPLPADAATQEPTENPETNAAVTAEPTPPPIRADGFGSWENEEIVYYNINGTYYHYDEHCSGMQGAQPHSTTERLRDGKQPCPVCVTEAEDVVVYHTENGKYYHYYMHCSGMMGAFANSTAEALNAGKEPCPVCVLNSGSGDWTEYPAPTPSAETTFVQSDAQPTPADRASDIFLNVFGVYIFDEFEDYEYISTNARGTTGVGGMLTEEIEFCFAKDGWQFTPVTVTIESRNDKILSGNIRLESVEGFDFNWTSFCENCSLWYQNVCDLVATLEGKHLITSAGEQLSEGIDTVCVHFDSELKPSVFTVDYQYRTGYFNMGFDILDDGQAELTNMSYNKTKA